MSENLATATRPDQPVYLLYSAVTETTVENLLGVAEYSYFFVREIFRRMLEKHAEVVVVTDPPGEADRLYDTYRGQGRECVLLSFAPPHKTFIDLRCPTIPVFAWEFDTIPTEVWDDEPRNDWRFVLSRLGRAITHSKYSVEAVKSAMGVDFPVVSIPAPVWDTIRRFCGDADAQKTGFELFVQGTHFDSRDAPAHETPEPQQKRLGLRRRLELSVSHFAWWYREVLADLLPTPLRIFISKFVRLIYSPFRGKRSLAASDFDSMRFDEREIIYTSVFNPVDGRKNWRDMMTAFCSACAACENATLIFKFIHRDSSWEYNDARAILSRLPPYRCRVVVIDGFLDDDSYRQLIARSAFVATSSLSEGQCLPLLEFLSCGKPAVSTRNTAMQDYLDGDIGFIARSSPELCCWPHDTRNVLRAHRYRVDWQSLKLAFEDSYRVATRDPKRYEQMGARAIARMRNHCSEAVALSKLESFLAATGTRIEPTKGLSEQLFTAVNAMDVERLSDRLRSLTYFREAAVPALESDYELFDLGIEEQVRQISERFDIRLETDGTGNFVHIHRGAERLKHPTPLKFGGTNNHVIIDKDCGFRGALTFTENDNVVMIFGGEGRFAMDATLYSHDTLVCGKGVFAWGLRVWVQGGTICTIGDGSLFSEDISIRTTDHHSIVDLQSKRQINAPADVTIGKHVWIGPGCTILKGVDVGDGAIIAAHSVVTHSVPNTELWAGVPAKLVRKNVSWVRSHPEADLAELGQLFDLLQRDRDD